MSPSDNRRGPEIAAQPSLSQLLAGYLQHQSEAQAAGLAAQDPGEEIVAYEAGPVQPVDAPAAWTEALSVVRFFAPKVSTKTWQAPPQWPSLVAAHEPAVALAFCLGNFPQLVRNLHPLLHAADLADLRPIPAQPLPVPALSEWARQMAGKRQFPATLLAVGTLRLARQFASAAELVRSHEADVPAEWHTLWQNEKAALAWHSGQAEQARALWLAQPMSVPVLFNRGMAALFLGETSKAREALGLVVAQLPETTAWHHLAGLYLTLAQSHA